MFYYPFQNRFLLMEFQIPLDLKKQKEFIVEKQYLATFLGSGSVEVLSTPSMILFMEMVSRIMMDEVLPESHTTVGTEVCIKHLNACPVDSKVIVISSLKEQKGKRLTFNVDAWVNDKKMGEGTHERAIIDKNKFKERVLTK